MVPAALSPRCAADRTSSSARKQTCLSGAALIGTIHHRDPSRSSDAPSGTGLRFGSALDWMGSTRLSSSLAA